MRWLSAVSGVLTYLVKNSRRQARDLTCMTIIKMVFYKKMHRKKAY